MAAVESISEVIKDSDKEHVSTTLSEVGCEKTNMFNGEAESKSLVSSKCMDSHFSNDVTVDGNDVADDKVSIKTVASVMETKDENRIDLNGKNTDKAKGLENDVSHQAKVKHEPNNEESSTGNDLKRHLIGSESSNGPSNGVVGENSTVDCDAKCPEVKVEQMDVDEDIKCKNEEDIKSESKTASAKDSNNENVSQDFLLNKLGFSAVKQLSLENMHAVKNENIDMSNYDAGLRNKLVLRAQENIVGEILEDKSNISSRSSSPGIVMNGIISDKDDHRSKKLSEQRTLIDTLKEDLRNEEAKLLLLRKVFDSQTNRKNGSLPLHKMKENSGRHMSMPSLHPKNRVPSHSYSGSPSDGSSSIQIAPKVIMGSKGTTPGSNLPRIVPSIVSSNSTTSPSTNESPRVTYAQMHGNVPTTGAVSQPVHKYYIQVGNQLVPAAPPTCINQPVYAMPVYSNASSSSAKVTSSLTTAATVPSVKPKAQPTPESQASKHSAAKAALRRQLEQTLLQIPPPRPPSADWRVIPNVNSMDFMMLVGLDEIVDMILENDGKPTLKNILTETLPENPLICNQCGMDFSPQWKQKESEKPPDVLCEKCSLTNTKKDLKAEHTSRLKSAFLKALKQEQEIEEKIKAGEDVNIGSPPLEKDSPAGVIPHHQPMHSVHNPYKPLQKGPKSKDHHHQIVHHHHHPVVQHYPHHTSLVHQLHQQHMQQQQVDYDPPGSSSHRNARWHPYIPSHHHGSSHVHGVQHHRTYSGSSSRGSDARHEYYVVHHPQHSSSSARWAH